MNPNSQVIRYGHSSQAWGGYENFLYSWLDRSRGGDVLEVGGGANPTVPIGDIEARGLRYTVMDISADELDKAPTGYEKLCADITAPSLPVDGNFDFVFSRMLAEHVKNGEQFHRNIMKLLKPGGVAFHFFPTLWTVPFTVNWLLPERLADWVLMMVDPKRDRYRLGKFPAYYSWCRGPTARQIGRMESLGFEVVEYHGFFGNRPYYKRLPLLAALHDRRVDELLRTPNPQFTSFAYLVVRKPVT